MHHYGYTALLHSTEGKLVLLMHHSQKMTVTTISFKQVMEDQRLKGWFNPMAFADEKKLGGGCE